MTQQTKIDETKIKAICESCKATFKARAALAGKKVKCPHCGGGVLIPKLPESEGLKLLGEPPDTALQTTSAAAEKFAFLRRFFAGKHKKNQNRRDRDHRNYNLFFSDTKSRAAF